MNEIEYNLNVIKERMKAACIKSGRHPDEVKLLLATKTVDLERIKIALNQGAFLIGENKVQELKSKFEDLQSHKYDHHFIGHLQTNKIKDILQYNVACLQSLDRLELAEKLQQRLQFEDKTMDALIQINTSGEISKFGVNPENAIELVQQISTFDRIKIKGLMTIGLFSAEEEKVRACFKLLKQIQMQIKSLQISNVDMDVLSMGMSGDLEIAIEEGATIVRVGTAIFGKRNYPDSYYWNETKG